MVVNRDGGNGIEEFEGAWSIPESMDGENEFVSEMRMSRGEIDTLLSEADVGVLSLARGNSAYSLPMSYGYSPEEDLLCLMIGYAPQSRKREWIDGTETATFVVHRMEKNREARSVVVEGRLVEVQKEDEERAYRALNNASFTVLHETGAAIEDSDHSIHRFEVESVEGRKFEHDVAVGR